MAIDPRKGEPRRIDCSIESQTNKWRNYGHVKGQRWECGCTANKARANFSQERLTKNNIETDDIIMGSLPSVKYQVLLLNLCTFYLLPPIKHEERRQQPLPARR